MNFLQRLFRRHEVRSWQGPLSGQALHGHSLITPANAESLSTVFACVAAISSSISALPAIVYRQDGKARQEAESGDIQRLVKYGPNQWQTWPEFTEFLVAQVLLRGNGLVEIVSGRDGHVEELRVLPWDWVTVQMLPNGRLVYDVFEQIGIYGQYGQRRRLLQGNVIHIRDRSDDGVIGKSRLQRCAATVRGAQTVHDFAAAAFRNGFYPSGVIMTDAVLNAGQRREMNDAFTRGFAGAANAARAFILDQGMKWDSQNAISPEDAELLSSRKFTTEELCRLFQVPPPIIQDYSHNTFTNSEQAGRWFSQFCLLPWVRKIEASFNRALFADTDYELALDMSSFDRGDPTTRWQAHAIAASNEILTVDEIREIEGWGPKPLQSDADE